MLELKEIIKAYQTANLVQVALNKVSVAFRDNEFVAVYSLLWTVCVRPIGH